MNGIIGKKIGMTQIFDEQGHSVPVTVVEAGPCAVVQRKTSETDGYDAVQLGFEDQREQRHGKALRGHYGKAGASTKRHLREFRVDSTDELKAGDSVDASIFEGVSHVDITALTKGRGFQGVVKRHGMSGGRKSHGSGNHRKGGSIGQCVSPARVYKGRKMPGQMGNKQITTQNIKLVNIRLDDNVILVRGGVPGPNGAVLVIRKALKKAVPSS